MTPQSPILTCCGTSVIWKKPYTPGDAYEAKCPKCGMDFAYSEKD